MNAVFAVNYSGFQAIENDMKLFVQKRRSNKSMYLIFSKNCFIGFLKFHRIKNLIFEKYTRCAKALF